MSWIGTKIDLVMPLVDIQCLGQLARTGTKPLNIFYVAPLSHEAESTLRFNRPDENETISRATLHEHVQHPMNTIIEVDVGRSGSVSFNISTRAWAAECMGSFIALDQISFRFDDETCALSPNEFRADQILRALKRINLEKTSPQHISNLAGRLESASTPPLVSLARAV